MKDKFANRIINREDGITHINIMMDFTCAIASLKSACIMDNRPDKFNELSKIEISLDPDYAQRLLDMQIGMRRVIIDRSRFLCILHGEDVSVSTLCKVQRSMKCWEEAMSEMFVDEFSEWTVEHPNNQIGA